VCRKALHAGCSDPRDDRDKIIAVKTKNTQLVTAHCDWITNHPIYRSWESLHSGPQLLWISSVEERGKTMMAIHLSQKLEKAAERNNSTVLYFFVEPTGQKGHGGTHTPRSSDSHDQDKWGTCKALARGV
jgi:hypothetical protein